MGALGEDGALLQAQGGAHEDPEVIQGEEAAMTDDDHDAMHEGEAPAAGMGSYGPRGDRTGSTVSGL